MEKLGLLSMPAGQIVCYEYCVSLTNHSEASLSLQIACKLLVPNIHHLCNVVNQMDLDLGSDEEIRLSSKLMAVNTKYVSIIY